MKMKKFVSIILVLALTVSLSATGIAAAGKCDCGIAPVVFVPGIGEPIYSQAGTEDEVGVMPPNGKAIAAAIPDLLIAIGAVAIAQDYNGFGTYAMKAVEKMLGDMRCNSDGTASEGTGILPRELPTDDHHKVTDYYFGFPGEDDINGEYIYYYDWRIDPIDNARGLNDYIEHVKELTGHDEIVLSCHSQGNTIVASYLYLYGNDGIEKLVFTSPAYKGLSLIGSVFAGQVNVRDKEDALEVFLRGMLGYEDPTGQLVGAIMRTLNDTGITGALVNYVQNILDNQLDRILDECLVDIMGTMPGIWSFVPDEYYAAAKAKMFGDDEKYAELIKKVDFYHYNVQNNVENIIEKAQKNGTAVIISLGYNISSIPITVADATHSDYLIDTECMSLGSTCAAPFGSSFPADYKQAKYCSGNNHISADGMIDASTCAFPKVTWFIRGNGHSDFGDEYRDFLIWAILYDGQPTVFTDESYPQFMQINADDTLSPVTGAIPAETRGTVRIIIDSLITLIKDSVSK